MKKREQLKCDGVQCVNPGKTRKRIKKISNKIIRSQAKDISQEHPMINRYGGWAN